MFLGKNIRYLRKKRNLSQEDLALRMGYKSFTTIQKWETGSSEPPFKQLHLLSEIFNVDMNMLATVDIEADGFKIPPTPHSIPVLGRVAAGIPLEACEDILGWEEIPEEMAKSGEYFALQIKGDSMTPRICEGDVIIVRKQSAIESGEVAVVLINGSDAVVKKVKFTSTGIMLISYNNQYDPMIYTNEEISSLPISIIGKVVELRGKF